MQHCIIIFHLYKTFDRLYPHFLTTVMHIMTQRFFYYKNHNIYIHLSAITLLKYRYCKGILAKIKNEDS